jgi:tRNA(Ile2) C34 agmatinyltransferase TiaS
MAAIKQEGAYRAAYVNDAWRVIGPNGSPTDEVYLTMQKAASTAGVRNSQARRDAHKTQRPCLCCGQGFKSEGAHNRMCDDCRRRAQAMDTPFNVAPIRRHR